MPSESRHAVDGPEHERVDERARRAARKDAEARRKAERSAARDARRARKRAELLTAAIEVIRTDGPDVSMDRLAAAGGVTKPILYRHFGDRNGLTSAIALEFAGRLQAEIGRQLTGADEPEVLLRTTIDAYLGVVEQDTEVYRFITEVAAISPLGAEATRGFIAQIADQVGIVIAERMRSAGLEPAPARTWARAIVGAVHQVGDQWLSEDDGLARSEVVDRLARLLWGGLGSLAGDA